MRASRQFLGFSSQDAALTWCVLLLLGALAWVATIAEARALGNCVCAGMPLWGFLVMWIVMMAAMMFPSVAPVAILWMRGIGLNDPGLLGTVRIALFILGYLLAWAGMGLVAFYAFGAFERTLAKLPGAASWFGAAVFAAAGIYQLTPLKDVCLRHCRSPMALLARYTAFGQRAVDLRVGLHHGLYCGGCCWGLMLILVVVGVMNLSVMALLTAIIFLEKIWIHGPALARAAGVLMLAASLVALFEPQLFPGLRVP